MSFDIWQQAAIIIRSKVYPLIMKGRAVDSASPPSYTIGDPIPVSIDYTTGAILTKSTSGGGGGDTQYVDGVTQSGPTGTVVMGKTSANVIKSLLVASDGTLHVTIDALSSSLDSITAVSNVVSSISSPTNLKCTTHGTAVQGANVAVTKEVILTAYQSNTGAVYLGDSAVTNSSGTKMGIILTPGGSVHLAVSNLNLIYINSDSDGDQCGVFVS